MTSHIPLRQLSGVHLRALLLAIVVSMLAASCGSASEPLNADATRQFDIENNTIADLTSPGAEDVPREELRDAISRAQRAGTILRVVVADTNAEFVSAKSVVDRYGGTAISYQANRTSFEGASRDLSGDQLDRAVDAAKVELDIGDSATAFVEVLETEGLDKRGISLGRILAILFFILAAAVLVYGAASYLGARTRRDKERREFSERRAVLRDWASQLGPEVDALQATAVAKDATAKQDLNDASEFVASIVPKLDEAKSLGELDAAEMRIGRLAIKLRDLRSTLES